MWKSRKEIKKTYLDHLHSVRMSGLGHENSTGEIYSHMLETLREFDEGEKSLPFNVLTSLD